MILPALPHAPACLLAAALAAAAAAGHAAAVDVTVLGSDGKPLPEAAVFLESREARAATKPAVGVEIAQDNKQFTNRVTVVSLGSEVVFPNRDKVRHHVYSFSPAKTFELKLYVGTPANPVLFDKPGIAVLGCNIHDHMIAWVVVVETPHYGLAGADGRVTLDNVPPGSYRLRSWHAGLPPGAPAADQAIVVPAAGGRFVATLPLAAP